MSDKHIALAVMFDVPAGEDYRSHIPKFYEITKSGTDGCLYYGFATCGNKVFIAKQHFFETYLFCQFFRASS